MFETLMTPTESSPADPEAERPRPAEASSKNDKAGGWLSTLLGGKSEHKDKDTIRDTIAEYIDTPSGQSEEHDPTAFHERFLLSNILQLRDMTVDEIMVPRADIQALEVSTSQEDVLKFFTQVQVSRVPVYHDTLDDVWGTVHIKDILCTLAENKAVILEDLITDVPVISPSMPLLDLLLRMRQTRRHMALVVDEYGGIDGLVTIGDIIEAIVGEIDDEHDLDDDPQMVDTTTGAVLADARVDLDDFCARYGEILTEEEREENDTLGGLAFSLAGKVPVRGEILTHSSGMILEITDADPRKINRMRLRNIPKPTSEETLDSSS